MSGGVSTGPAAIEEAGFRANLREATTVWRTRLAAPDAVPRECQAIGREAAELRKVAESRGWWALAQHLGNVESLAFESPSSLPEAVAALARRLSAADEMARSIAVPPLIGAPASPAAPVPAPSAFSGALSVALPPMLNDLEVPRGARAPSPSPPPPSMIAPPSMLGSPAESLALPPPKASPSVPVAPPPSPEPIRRPEVARPPHVMSIADPLANAVAPPKLLVKDILGLNAFGKKEGRPEPSHGPVRSESGPLGLRKSPSHASSPSVPPREVFTPPALRRPEPSLPPADRGARRSSSPELPQRSHPPPRRPRERGRAQGIPVWFYVLGGGVAFLGIATVIIVLMSGHETALPNEPRVDAGAPVASHAPSSAPPPTVAPPSPTTVEVHNLGQETPQLRALIDAQSRLASNCKNDSPQCRSPWTAFAREAMDPNQAPITLEPAPAAAPLSSWLVKLKKPADFPLVEHPLLKGAYDYDAKHIVGHAQFQQTYRRCSEYSDIIEGALLKYGAPTWLVAVVYQESQCDPLAKSPVGAAGLWQFMPESARAYDLRVVEDEVDERLNPIKATDAGVRFLTDLERKLGSWDLALAAYNVGPYGVAARLNRVGGKAGFWDLVRAGLLPDETARYVPAIEAHALVLNNMAALDFDRGGSPKDDAADVRVRSGTRLSLVARAANTSTLRIHDLNLDFLEEVVPNGETTVRVPGSEARGAQDFLDTVPPSDKRDLCVPKNFDWGKTDFDTSPYAKSCGQGGAVQ